MTARITPPTPRPSILAEDLAVYRSRLADPRRHTAAATWAVDEHGGSVDPADHAAVAWSLLGHVHAMRLPVARETALRRVLQLLGANLHLVNQLPHAEIVRRLRDATTKGAW